MMENAPDKPTQRELERERNKFLHQLEAWLETPMVVLAFVWLVLLVVEFTWGATPLLSTTVTVIWVIFIVDFLLRFVVAPRKIAYLRRGWLTAISLVLPALRIARVFQTVRLLRTARAAQSLRLVRVVGSLNRGMRTLRATMRRRGAGYVAALTLVVVVVGAAGMYAFERNLPGGGAGFENYSEALWWTAMLLTTIGSEYWPQTPEGRILCLLLAIYSLGILGYIAAGLASFFIGRDVEETTSGRSRGEIIADLREENSALQAEIRRREQEQARTHQS